MAPSVYILTEASAGYALLKSTDKKLLQRTDLSKRLGSVEGLSETFRLKKFDKFDNATVAVEEMAKVAEGKVTPKLSSLLNSIKDEAQASLLVGDPKLGHAINKLPELNIVPVSDSSTIDIFRALRSNLSALVPALTETDLSTMTLGLAHSLSRHTLKFSVDKVDVMIIQAISLLDDFDKNLNTHAMRVKEWYGWHFPEMAKIINDNLAYARVVLKMGYRSESANANLSDILPEEIEIAVKAAADISMGTEIVAEDLEHIRDLAQQVVDLTEYRQQLNRYLSSRMRALAPNLTAMVGDLVGARLISHAGSLMSLAKSPASTIQILGAEKALFRALKTKHDTPKYGLIFHSSLVGQASGKNKGKIARMLAGKTALGVRIDSLSDWGVEGEKNEKEPTDEEKIAMAMKHREKLERQLSALEGRQIKMTSIAASAAQSQPVKWQINEARNYNPDADGLAEDAPAAAGEPSRANGAPKRPRLIQEVGGSAPTNGIAPASKSSDTMDQDGAGLNGSLLALAGEDESEAEESDEQKSARKLAKAQRKAEKAAKRDAKKAAKDSKKKRKRGEAEDEDEDNDAGGKSEKKKKKKK